MPSAYTMLPSQARPRIGHITQNFLPRDLSLLILTHTHSHKHPQPSSKSCSAVQLLSESLNERGDGINMTHRGNELNRIKKAQQNSYKISTRCFNIHCVPHKQ